MAKITLGKWIFRAGYVSSVARALVSDILAWGSENAIITGLGFVRAWKGITSIATNVAQGSRQFFHADGKYAGLGDVNDTNVRGSVFKAKNVLAFIGSGLLRFNGQSLGVSANSLLRYVEKSGSTYSSVAYQAGHARPQAPTIYPKTPGAGHTGMNGSVSTVHWRIDSKTGQVSLASLPSNILVLSNQSVIHVFPNADANAQDYWGIGVPKFGFDNAALYYELRTDLGGEVAESYLAFTRQIQAVIYGGTDIVENVGASSTYFTAADVGRRINISGFDTWITEVIDSTHARVNDTAPTLYSYFASTITHAVQGILRAVEIHWTPESLQGQSLAPFDAYPPVSNLQFGGIINDTLYVEDANGIIYVGVPGYIGSFPPKNALYPTAPATLYLTGADGVDWRFEAGALTLLSYVGGSRPLQLQQVWKNAGVKYPTNAAIGMGGRVIAFTNKPVRLGAGREPEVAFALRVYKDFEGWDAQTAAKPVVCGYDADKQLEVWAFDTKVMCYHVPSDAWCAPINLTPKLAAGEFLVSCVTIDNKLQLCTNNGANLRLHEFDKGSGSALKIKTPDVMSPGSFSTITQLDAVVHTDSAGANVKVKVITNFDDASPETVMDANLTSARANQHLETIRPNIMNVRSHALQIEITSAGGDSGVQMIETMGDVSNVVI